MVKIVVGPGLRELGFSGSGRAFIWPAEGTFAQVGIQKLRASNRKSVTFTPNASVADVERWNRKRAKSPDLPKRPAPNTFYGPAVWWRRVGKLMPAGDQWWRLDDESDIDDVGQNVVDVVARYVVPALIKQTRQSARR